MIFVLLLGLGLTQVASAAEQAPVNTEVSSKASKKALVKKVFATLGTVAGTAVVLAVAAEVAGYVVLNGAKIPGKAKFAPKELVGNVISGAIPLGYDKKYKTAIHAIAEVVVALIAVVGAEVVIEYIWTKNNKIASKVAALVKKSKKSTVAVQ